MGAAQPLVEAVGEALEVDVGGVHPAIELGARIRVDVSGGDRDVLDALLAAGGRDVDGIFQEDDRIVVGIGDGTAPGLPRGGGDGLWRSEEHTSELQSLLRISYAVFCL